MTIQNLGRLFCHSGNFEPVVLSFFLVFRLRSRLKTTTSYSAVAYIVTDLLPVTKSTKNLSYNQSPTIVANIYGTKWQVLKLPYRIRYKSC